MAEEGPDVWRDSSAQVHSHALCHEGSQVDSVSTLKHQVAGPHLQTLQLRCIARAVAPRMYPVLLQGPTSAGKTSVIEYLAAVTGKA